MGRGLYWKLALRNLVKNRRVYAPYLLSAVGIVMMFYIMSAMAPCIEQDDMYGGATVASIMNLGTGVIGIFAVLFLFYTNSFIMKRRKKELGLYNILGLEKRHIAKVILRETALAACVSIGLGLGFGVLFSRAMFLVLGKILNVEVPIAFTVPAAAVIATAVLFLLVFLLTMLYNVIQVLRAKPIELLRGGETGEREPKARWLLTILGLAALGTGYALAVTIQDPLDALTWFFAAVLLVIVGTYFLFISGTIALLKVLKRNKAFYYKARHFTTVSGMLYRMKQNAAGLASICILFTCLLVTVSCTFALYTGMEGLTRVRYPRNVLIYARDANDRAVELIAGIVDEECGKMGLAPENIVTQDDKSALALSGPSAVVLNFNIDRLVYAFDVNGDNETIADLNDALYEGFASVFPAEGAHFEALWTEDVGSSYHEFFALYGGLFFVGLFLGTLFLLGTALIIYYKQVSEGYEDARRFDIMQKVGMSRAEVKRSIRSQILTVFFLPLATAVVHLCFALPMLQKILLLMNLADVKLMLLSCAACVVLFGLLYAAIYLLTARTYYKIVETAAA